MFRSLMIVACIMFWLGVLLFILIMGAIKLTPRVLRAMEKINYKIIGGLDNMGNINVNEATKKNERNIIIIGVIGIVIALAMLGLSIWFLIAQLDIANQTNSSVGVAIGGFIGMIVGIALFITVGILIYCNAIRNVYIRNTINNKVESSQNSKNN